LKTKHLEVVALLLTHGAKHPKGEAKKKKKSKACFKEEL